MGFLEGTLSSVLNTALFGVKIWFGMATGSIAMVADAWHTLSDTATSIVVLVGFWVSGKPEDEKHPFGHGRAETIATVIIGVLLAVVGANFLKESVLRLVHVKAATFSVWAIVVFAGSAIVKEALAVFSIWAGRRYDAPSLTADGWHHRSDAIASALIAIAALAGGRLWWLDGVLGIAVSWLIFYAAWDIVKDAANRLMGEPVKPELREHISRIIREAAPEAGVPHHFHLHRYGDHREITLHLHLPPQYSLSHGHDLSTAVEERVRRECGTELTIHIEPLRIGGAGTSRRPGATGRVHRLMARTDTIAHRGGWAC